VTRARPVAAWLALTFAAAAGCMPIEPVAAQGPASAQTVPTEIEGQINGKKARFVARGDDVLVSAAEADRLGVAYREGKSLSIGGSTVWLVTLDAVTVAGRTRLVAPAGVVPSISGYFEALRAHPAEAFARSREIRVEINGTQVQAYDLGIGGVLLSIDAAEHAGLQYRLGKPQTLGKASAWVIEVPVKVGEEQLQATVTVAEPQAYFEAVLAGARPAH
jgi:hypothetical protein